jgi:hypothetical protein
LALPEGAGNRTTAMFDLAHFQNSDFIWRSLADWGGKRKKNQTKNISINR